MTDQEADIQVIDHNVDAESPQMIYFAKLACQLLTKHYPNHLWAVGFAPGMTLVIKNMGIAQGNYGYTIDVARTATISEVEKLVVMAGGELLERCGVKRGAWDGEFMAFKNLEYNIRKQER